MNKILKYSLIGSIIFLLFLVFTISNRVSDLEEYNDKLIFQLDLRDDFISFNPSYNEIERIIDEDDSHLMKYDELHFNCVDFTHRVIQKYFEKGIYSCMTTLYFEDGLAHANVAINTSDRGVIYIEPQTKVILDELTLNKDYCDYVNFDCDEPWILIEYKSCFDDLRESVK
jgi:hypothetical protein